jgi:glycosyltransferase involved in cell wall biosynthesis
MASVKVGFVLLSNRAAPAPSTRIAVLNMLPFLHAAGFDAEVLFEPPASDETPGIALDPRSIAERGFDVVVFQKVRGPSAVALARGLRALGVKTVYLVCDLIDREMTEATHLTVVVTDYLRSLYPDELRPRVQVVHDGIEHPEHCKRDWGRRRGSPAEPLDAVLVTSHDLDRLPAIGDPPDWLRVTIVGRYPPRDDARARRRAAWWKLQQAAGVAGKLAYARFLRHPRIRREAWHAEQVYQRLLAADIGIIPVEARSAAPSGALAMPPAWQVKSENRLTLMLAAALPVVATPIPSYLPIIDHGRTAYAAVTPSEWRSSLEALRDPARREAVGRAGRAAVVERYSQRAQAERLVAVLHMALGGEQPRARTL